MKKPMFFKIAVFILLGLLLLPFVLMNLWNWLIPAIFVGVKTITYLQALGLFILSRIIFGFKGGRRFGGHGRFARGYCHNGENHPCGKRFGHFSPEERAAFKISLKAKLDGQTQPINE